MRVLARESKDLRQLILEAGLLESDFDWVKRRGKLHVIYRPSKASLAYFRRTETRLNDQLQWEKEVLYFLFIDNKLVSTEGWNEVKKAYELWFKELPH